MKVVSVSRIACAALALTALALPARAETAAGPTTVIGDVHLRMPLAEVKAKYPGMKPLLGGMGSAFADGPQVQRFALKGVALPGLEKPADLELRFWEEKLWAGIVYFGDNDDAAVRAALTKRLGAGRSTAAQAFWEGPDYAVGLQSGPRWYSVQDPQMSAEAQRWFLEVMGRKATPPAAAAPPTAAAPHD